MTAERESRERLTVVVVPDDPLTDELLATVSNWTRAGVLEPSCWVRAGDVEQTAHAGVRAHLVTHESGPREEDLFVLLGRRRLELVRLVALRVLMRTQPPPDMGDVPVVLADRLSRELPRPVDATGRGGTRLLRVNLLAPETGARDVSPAPVLDGWDVNAVVSPEDRAATDQSNILVRRDLNLVGHVAGAVASAGGLWRGVREGVFDRHERDSGSDARMLVAFRTNVRLVRQDDLGEQVCMEVLDRLTGPLGEDAGRVDATHADSLLDDLEVRWPVLTFRRPARRAPTAKHERGVGAAMTELVRFSGSAAASLPRWVLEMMVPSLERAATGFTAGHEGQYVVRSRPRNGAALEAEGRARLERESRDEKARARDELLEDVPAPPPDMWRDVRALAFSLVDGDAPPDGIQRLQRGDRLAPSAVVARPTVEAPATGTDGGSGTPDETAPEVTDRAGTDGSPTDPATDTVLGRLRDRVSAGTEAAQTCARRAKDRLENLTAPDAGEAERARRWFIKASLLLLVGTVAGAVVLPRWLDLTTQETVGTVASLVLVVLVCWMLFVARRYYQAVSAYERGVAVGLEEIRHASQEWVDTARESRRLDLVVEELDEWTRAIGCVVHASPAQRPVDEAEETALESRTVPAAVGIADPVDQQLTALDGVVEHCLRRLTDPGWATDRFALICRHLEASDKAAGRRGDHAFQVARLDDPRWSGFTRRRLAERAGAADVRDRLGEDVRDTVRQLVDSGEVTLPRSQVVGVGPFGQAVATTHHEFLTAVLGPSESFADEVWADAGKVRRKHIIGETRVWLPTRLQEVAPVGDEATCLRDSAAETCVRVDVSEPCVESDLAIFENRTPAHVDLRTRPDDLRDGRDSRGRDVFTGL